MSTPTLIRKTAVAEIKALDEIKGIVEAYVNSLDVVDFDQEVIAPGAFDKSIATSLPAVAWMHDQRTIVGGVTEAREDRKRLLATMQFDLDTDVGAYAFKMVARGRVKEWSVGFYATDWSMEERDRKSVRVIKEVEWVEVSPVLRGASPGTVTIDAKAHDAEHEHDHEPDGLETLAPWDAAYINNLPDSAFAVILPGGEKDSEGKTTPRSLRKLPHHNADGGIDLPHLRNALSRLPQANLSDAQKATARAHLTRHASAEGVGEASQQSAPATPAAAGAAGTDPAAALSPAYVAAVAELLTECRKALVADGVLDPDPDPEAERQADPDPETAPEQKAGRTMSSRNLTQLHDAMQGLDALHGATCDMGESCPMYQGG